jgi:hypothetical protein
MGGVSTVPSVFFPLVVQFLENKSLASAIFRIFFEPMTQKIAVSMRLTAE